MSEIPIFLPQIADGEDKSSQFKNCIRKNYRHLRKWAKRTETDSFRIYDREINHYPLAIDFYAGRFCVHYFSKHREEEEPEPAFAEEVEDALCSIFATTKEMIYWRTRIRRRKLEQYEKADLTNDFFTVYEYGLKFRVNLLDYLDTGLFLDHRETRKLIGSLSEGKRVLNLFAYTCAFSIHAAAGGASYTKSVDMSNTYTAWGRENFRLNGFSEKNHVIIREDCLKFLDEEIAAKVRYDLIIIDPPTISRSKKMTQMFDIQLDYLSLINKGMKLLNPEGTLFFSTNSRRFIFDETLQDRLKVIEISHKTLPLDFHDPKIHRCWKISKK
jgi:23S rRNA G2069 N7-methylase RlmK/C1962 C5-methylase RlmI